VIRDKGFLQIPNPHPPTPYGIGDCPLSHSMGGKYSCNSEYIDELMYSAGHLVAEIAAPQRQF